MSAKLYFDWPTARLAGLDGNPVRRKAWTDRWLYFYNGLWWVMPATGTPYVVTTNDFTEGEFRAVDWTNLSIACVGSSQESGGGAAACPLPFDAASPATGPLALTGSSSLPI